MGRQRQRIKGEDAPSGTGSSVSLKQRQLAAGPAKAQWVTVLGWCWSVACLLSDSYFDLQRLFCMTTLPSLFAFWLPGKVTQGGGGCWQKIRRK